MAEVAVVVAAKPRKIISAKVNYQMFSAASFYT